MTTAITPATEPTILAIIVILLSLFLLDGLLEGVVGEVDVDVGPGCTVLPVPPGVAEPGQCEL